MPARAPRLEVREEVLWGDVCVNGRCVSELAVPCISDDGEEELCRLLSSCLVRRSVCALRLVRHFSAHAEDGSSIFVD